MSKKRTFRRENNGGHKALRSEQQLTQEPIAVYYRQSTTAQVGNISTSIQTIDMVEELERRGWEKEKIILIDDDEGVSGTKRIDERKGMSYLFELIADHKIAAVACQDEDRLFRDMTQIQVNIFIDTCRKSQVCVITPFFTYDFAHPQHGEFHARQFRFKCDMAAEYLNSYVLGRLAPARRRLLLEGKWAGAHMPVGYMVDMRKQLPTGDDNPNWRKFVPFEPYAQIVREYFRLLRENGGAIRRTMYQIRDLGLSFPYPQSSATRRFQNRLSPTQSRRGDSSYTPKLHLPSHQSRLCRTLGYKGVVQCWNNHAPIVDLDTFFAVFNMLSPYTLTGEENDNYQPAYPYVRQPREVSRRAEPPLLTGLIYTRTNHKWYRAGYMYPKREGCYLMYNVVQSSRER